MKSIGIIVLVILLSALCVVQGSLSNVQFTQGRFDLSNLPIFAQFSWSAVQFEVDFVLSSPSTHSIVNITLSDNYNYYSVELLDSASGKVLLSQVMATTNAQQFVYSVQFNTNLIEFNKYTVRVGKRTEGYFANVQLFNIEVLTQSATVKYILPERSQSDALKIEWIGDSLSCGYGNEGKSPCSFTKDTENGLLSFPVRTSLMLDPQAKYNVVSFSGKGVVRNYGDQQQVSRDPMPVYYNRTLTSNPQLIWSYKTFVPDLVVITLGGNDLSTTPRPSFEQYSLGYNNLVDYIRKVYSSESIPIVGVCGPLAYDCWGDYTQQVIQQSRDPNIHFVSLAGVLDGHYPGPDYGCDGHPSVTGDEKMSVKLSEALKQILKR